MLYDHKHCIIPFFFSRLTDQFWHWVSLNSIGNLIYKCFSLFNKNETLNFLITKTINVYCPSEGNNKITFLLFLHSSKWDVKCDNDKRAHLHHHHLFSLHVKREKVSFSLSYTSYVYICVRAHALSYTRDDDKIANRVYLLSPPFLFSSNAWLNMNWSISFSL
jgi:hypothetical protein